MLAQGGDGGVRIAGVAEVERGLVDLGGPGWSGHLHEAAAGSELIVLPKRQQILHEAVGDPAGSQAPDQLFGGNRCEHRVDQRLEIVDVGYTVGVVDEPGIVDERPILQDVLGEVGPVAVALHADHHQLAIAHPVHAVGSDHGVAVAGPRRHRALAHRRVGGRGRPLGDALQHRHLDGGALAGRLPAVERGQDRREGVHGRGDVRYRESHLAGLLGGAGEGHRPALGLHGQIVGLVVGTGTAKAVAGDVAGDQAGELDSELVGQDAGPSGRGGRQVLHEHVRSGHQPVEDGTVLGILQVQLNALLAPVGPHEECGRAAHRTVVVTGEVALAGALHLEDAGAEVGQLAGGERRSNRRLQRDHDHTFQRRAHRDVSQGTQPMAAAGRIEG